MLPNVNRDVTLSILQVFIRGMKRFPIRRIIFKIFKKKPDLFMDFHDLFIDLFHDLFMAFHDLFMAFQLMSEFFSFTTMLLFRKKKMFQKFFNTRAYTDPEGVGSLHWARGFFFLCFDGRFGFLDLENIGNQFYFFFIGRYGGVMDFTKKGLSKVH